MAAARACSRTLWLLTRIGRRGNKGNMDMQRLASARPANLRRALIAAAAVTALVLALTPQVLATDVADIGIVDQAAIGNLSQFQDAKTQLTRIQQQLQSQFQAAI